MYVYAENEGPNLSGSNLNRNTDRHTDRHTDTQTDMPEIITYPHTQMVITRSVPMETNGVFPKCRIQ